MMKAIQADTQITNQNKIVGPGIQGSSKNWTLEDMIESGYFSEFSSELSVFSVEQCVLRSLEIFVGV